MNRQNPSVAIIGHGTIGSAHRKTLLEYQAAGKVGPIYSIDSNPAQLVGQDPLLTAGSLEELTGRGVAPDVVLIAANTAMRQENYRQLLSYAHKLPVEARPSLFVEKPVADMNHDIGMMQADFNALGYGSKVPLAFAYLIRSSAVVEAAVDEFKKCAEFSSYRDVKANIVWQKQRDNKRITPGVHIDESTHGIDTTLYLFERAGIDISKLFHGKVVPVRNSQLPLDKINSFFNVADQVRTYGANHNPLASVEYGFTYFGEDQDVISGSSSFVTGPQLRRIRLSGSQFGDLPSEIYSHTVELLFDTKDGDVMTTYDVDNKPVSSKAFKQTNLMDSKIGREWGFMLDYHHSGVRNQALCSLDEAVRDLDITKTLETPLSPEFKK